MKKSVGSIVASLFVSPYSGSRVYHADLNNKNNRASNLVWLSEEECGQFRIENEMAPLGEEHPNVKLTESEVLKIREIYASGLSTQRSLAVQFGVGRGCICEIVSRRNWKHI